jgi:polysaccharide biosynthesis transport protein
VVAGLRSTNVNVVDYADQPAGPSDPKIPLILFLGLGGGLFLGVVGAFVLENLDDSLSSTEEAEIYSGLPSLAAIPLVAIRHSSRKILRTGVEKSGAVHVDRIALTHPNSHAAEAFRALRTSILLSRSENPPKTILVTSTFPGEGKSTTSLNAAVTLAQEDARVLLIDADMRRSSLHRSLGLESQPGLSAVLTGSRTLEECIAQIEQLPNLHLLPGGALPPHPAELLGSPAMKNLLQQCREKYDFIVIDTPPVLTVTDGVILAAEADATVLVMRAGQTSRQGLRRARNLLLRAKAKIVGLVINGIDLNSPDHYYYYGRSKYHKYHSNYYSGYYDDPTTPQPHKESLS